MYTSNGAAVAIACRSAPAAPEPDIFCMALLARFEGLLQRFFEVINARHDYLTWALLKRIPKSRRLDHVAIGRPRDTPLVNFNYSRTAMSRRRGPAGGR